MKMISRTKVLAIVMAAALAGCTSPYGPKGPTGGYGEVKVGPDTYRVSYDGNGNTSEEQVVDFWLYRCAELTLQNGYTYFGLAPESQSRREEGAPRMVQVKGGGGYVYVPSYSTTTVRTWHKQATIVMYRSRPGSIVSAQSYALHAQTVINMLREYVQSGGRASAPPRKEVIEAAMRYTPDHPGAAVQQGGASLDDLSDLLNAPK